MLVLSRKVGEDLMIGDNIRVTVVKINGKSIRLGIEAPNDVNIRRGELSKFSPVESTEIDLPVELVLAH